MFQRAIGFWVIHFLFLVAGGGAIHFGLKLRRTVLLLKKRS